MLRRLLLWIRGEHESLEVRVSDQKPANTSYESIELQDTTRSHTSDERLEPMPPTSRIRWESLDKQIAARQARSGFFMIRCPRCGYEYMKSERGRAPCPECGYDVRARRYCWTCMRWIPALAIIHQDEDNQFCPLCFYNIIHQRRGRLIFNLIKYPLIVILIGAPIWLLLIYLRWGEI